MLSEFNGHHCQHRSDDFPVIAEILTPHRPQVVVELGTDEGGFSAFLADLVAPWGGHVTTFDREAKFAPHLLATKNLTFVLGDVLSAPHPEILSRIAQPGALLYCDNGHKVQEVSMYAEHLPLGGILGVHDYNTEIMGEWVEPFVADLGFAPLGHAAMEALRNEWYTEPMTRFWLRTAILPEPEPAKIPRAKKARKPRPTVKTHKVKP
jgi:cephalosporin hydroxylase